MQDGPFQNNIYHWIIIIDDLMCSLLYVAAGAHFNDFIYCWVA